MIDREIFFRLVHVISTVRSTVPMRRLRNEDEYKRAKEGLALMMEIHAHEDDNPFNDLAQFLCYIISDYDLRKAAGVLSLPPSAAAE